jgi:hypothetical protein
MNLRFGIVRSIVVVALLAAPVLVQGAERRKPTIKRGDYNPQHATVEMFEGVKSGQLEVRIILQDAKDGKLFIENKTDQPLNVKLPDAFVAVLAQAGFGAGFGNQPAGNQGGAGQGFQNYGGLGGMGMPGMMGGFGGGFFNVPAERVGEIPVQGVCLNHGLKEPRPNIPYKVVAVEEYSSDPALKELLAMYAEGRYTHAAAQAAAWHIANGLSWQELAGKYIQRANGQRVPYFAPQDLRLAMHMASTAKQRSEKSPGSTVSASTTPVSADR